MTMNHCRFKLNQLTSTNSQIKKKKQKGEGVFGFVYEVKNKTDESIYAAKISKNGIYECLKNYGSNVLLN